MKWLAGILCLALVLTGCGSETGELDTGMELRSKVLAAETVSFDAQITADYGDKVHTFSMSCQGDSLGNLNFTVTEPESISGITGRIDQKGGALTFDDKALHFDLMADEALSPVSAPWILVKTLRSGYLTSACREEGKILLTIDDSYEDDALTLDIRLDGNNLPEWAEILHRGRKILSMKVANFVLS